MNIRLLSLVGVLGLGFLNLSNQDDGSGWIWKWDSFADLANGQANAPLFWAWLACAVVFMFTFLGAKR